MKRPEFRLVAWTFSYLQLLEALGKSSVALPLPARKG